MTTFRKTLPQKTQRQIQRKRRVRKAILGATARLRLSVYRSSQHISAQIVDDATGKTLVSASDKGLKGTKTERAALVGKSLAEKAKEKKVKSVVFDRSGRLYHGRVKALAEGAREGGLEF